MEGGTGIGESGFPGPAIDRGEMLECGFQTALQLRESEVLDLMAGRAKSLYSGQHLPGFPVIVVRKFENLVVPTLMGFDGMLWALAAADLAMVVGFPVALLADSVPIFRREGGTQVLAVGGVRDQFHGKAWSGLRGRFWVRSHFQALGVRRGRGVRIRASGSRSLEYRNGNGRGEGMGGTAK